MQGRTKEEIVDEKVNEVLCTPARSNPDKSIAEVLLDGSYDDDDLKFFAISYSFPFNKDYRNDSNSYSEAEVARAFVDRISPYLTSQEINSLTERAVSVECEFSDGPLRKSTLAKALLNKILIDHKNDAQESGTLPEQFLIHMSNPKVMNRLFGQAKERIEAGEPAALRSANLTIHDLFIKMLVESDALTKDEAKNYGYKEYSFEDMLAKKPDERVFVNYYDQLIQSKSRAEKGKEERTSKEETISVNAEGKQAFLAEHPAKHPTIAKAASDQPQGSPAQPIPPRKAKSEGKAIKSRHEKSPIRKTLTMNWKKPKVSFREKLASLRLEVGMFNEILNNISDLKRLNESIRQAGYLGYSQENKRVPAGLEGVKFAPDGNLLTDSQFKFDPSMDARVAEQLQLYFNVNRNSLNDRQVIIYNGLGFGCSQHPVMGEMMGEPEFRPDAKGRVNINVSALNNVINERIFKTLGISVDANGAIQKTQDMEAAKKAYNAVSGLVDFYNAAIGDKSFPKKDLKSLEKLLSSMHAILESPTHDFSKNIINTLNSEYEKYFQKTMKKKVNPELGAYRQGLLNIINGRSHDNAPVRARAQPDAEMSASHEKAVSPKTSQSDPLPKNSSRVSQSGMFAPPPIPPKPSRDKTQKLLDAFRNNPTNKK